MTDLYEMKHSAIERLKMIEMKMFVVKWMILRTKIAPTISPQKNITVTKAFGGFVRTKQVPILSQCSVDLTSNKHCSPCGSWKKKKKKLNETNDRHKVLFLFGWAGKDHGGLLFPTKVTMETYPVLIDQGNLINRKLGHFFKAWFCRIHRRWVSMHTHEYIHGVRTCTHCLIWLVLFIHIHIGSSSSFVRTSSTCHPCVQSLHFDLRSPLPSFPPVLLPLPFLLLQRGAAAGAQS